MTGVSAKEEANTIRSSKMSDERRSLLDLLCDLY